jgi:hypothetical protein
MLDWPPKDGSKARMPTLAPDRYRLENGSLLIPRLFMFTIYIWPPRLGLACLVLVFSVPTASGLKIFAADIAQSPPSANALTPSKTEKEKEKEKEKETRDYFEVLAFKATAATACVTVIFGLATGGWAVWLWRRDYRWKQAELARRLLDDIYEYELSNAAWGMVDGKTHFQGKQGEVIVNMDDVRRALRLPLQDGRNESARYKNLFIRECFDALFII